MKNRILWLALDAVFLVVFNVCFFVLLQGAREQGIEEIAPSIWVSYAFIHLSYLLLIATPLFVRRGNRVVADYARPLYVGTWLYFLITLVINLVFILVSMNSALVQMFMHLQVSPKNGLLAWLVNSLTNSDGITAAWLLNLLGSPIRTSVAWIVNIILFGAVMVFLLANALANEDTAEKQERHERELVYVKTAASRLKSMVDNCNDKNAEAALEKLYYLVNSSPLRSCTEANMLEREVLDKLDDLEDTENVDKILQICDEMTQLAKRRNRIVNERNSK